MRDSERFAGRLQRLHRPRGQRLPGGRGPSECLVAEQSLDFLVFDNKDMKGMNQLQLDELEDELEMSSFMMEKIVPHVAYRDWSDFVARVYETQRMFNDLILEGVEHERNMQVTKPARHAYSFVSPDHPPLPIFTGDCFQIIADRGSGVIKNMTGGRECAFTRLVAKTLFNQCMRVVSAYSDVIYYHTCYQQENQPRKMTSTLLFDYEHLGDLMKSSVQFAFSGLMPVTMCFSNRGFTAALMSKNFCVLDGHSKHIMSISQYQDFVLALMLGLHSRLGLDSPLFMLDVEILRKIIATLRMPPNMALTEFVNRELWLF